MAITNAKTKTTKKLCSDAAFNNAAINTKHISINNAATLMTILLYFLFLFTVNLIPPLCSFYLYINYPSFSTSFMSYGVV